MGSLCGRANKEEEDPWPQFVITDPYGDDRPVYRKPSKSESEKASILSLSLDEEGEVIEWTSSGMIDRQLKADASAAELRFALDQEALGEKYTKKPHANYEAVQKVEALKLTTDILVKGKTKLKATHR